MARRILAALLAAVCLLAAGCRREEAPPPEPAPPPAAADPAPVVRPKPVALERLSVEVVVDWEDADRMLGSLEELSRLLEEALLAYDCAVEDPVAVTIGTAGGITAQALRDGGIDAAFLPEADLAEIGDDAEQILESEGPAAAVTAAREELGEDFPAALAQALLETEAGQTFLEICYPGVEFAAAADLG